MRTRNGLHEGTVPMWRVMAFSFLVVPVFIGAAAIVFFTAIAATIATDVDIYELLDDVRYGSASKRWQSAYRLSQTLLDPAAIPQDERFVSAVQAAFHHTAGEPDPAARQYIALAMGHTGNGAFVPALLDAIESDPPENRPYLIHGLGLLKDPRAAAALVSFVRDPAASVRLQAVIALGAISDPVAAEALAATLRDPEPNVRWDAAIALAKLGDTRGKAMLLQLLDRAYLEQFEALDAEERDHIIITTSRAASLLQDSTLDAAIDQLSRKDPNMGVRTALASLALGGGP